MSNSYYSESFKLAAVRQVLENGQSISQTARNNKVTNSSLKRWIDLYKNDLQVQLLGKVENHSTDEIDKLKKNLFEITEERDILKSALLIIAKDIHFKSDSFIISNKRNTLKNKF